METAVGKLLEQGVIGILAVICLSGLIYFYKKVEDGVRENKENAVKSYENQVKENEKLHSNINELRLKIDKIYIEDRNTLMELVRKCIESLDQNTFIMKQVMSKDK